MALSLSKGDLWTTIFVDFTEHLLGWDPEHGVTRPENLKEEVSTRDALVCSSNVKHLRVLVIGEVLEEDGVRILTLSDGQFKIHALVWRHTQGIQNQDSLQGTVLALHDFDISVRHTSLAHDGEDVRELHELLQYHLVIHNCEVVLGLSPTHGSPLHVRHKSNVKQFLKEFKLWSTQYEPSNLDEPVPFTQMPSRDHTGMDGISTQIPFVTQPARSDIDTQSTGASQIQTNTDTQAVPSTPAEERKIQLQSQIRAQARPVPYDGDADWARVTSRPRISSRDGKIPAAQMATMQWAPAPGTRNVVPALPKKDLDEMIDFVDNPDEYINLLEHVSNDDDGTPPPHQTGTADENDVEESDEEGERDDGLIAYALQNRGGEDEREATPVTASQWPTSPIQAARLGPEALSRVSPPQFSLLEDSSSGEEDDLKDELPPDSDEDPTQQLVAELNNSVQQPSSATMEEEDEDEDEDEDVRIRKPARLSKELSHRQARVNEHNSGDNESDSGDGLPDDENELQAMLKAERDSPFKAQLHRKLKRMRESRTASRIHSSTRAAGSGDNAAAVREDIDMDLSDAEAPFTQPMTTRESQTDETQQEYTTSPAKFQVGRTPYSGVKQTRRQPSTSPPPSSRTDPPTSSVVYSSGQSPRSSAAQIGHSREQSSRILVGIAVPAMATTSPDTTPVPRSSHVHGSPLSAEAASPSLKRKQMQEQGKRMLQKKQRLVKPVTQESFELSQGLADHAGSQYNVDSMRAEFMAQKRQAMSPQRQGVRRQPDSTAIEHQDKELDEDETEFELDYDRVEGNADAPMEDNDGDAMQVDGDDGPVVIDTLHGTGGEKVAEREEEEPQAMEVDNRGTSASWNPTSQTMRPSHIHSSVLNTNGHTTAQSRGSSTVSSRLQELPGEPSLYDTFKQAYPSWTGTRRDFVDQCKAIIPAKIMTTFQDDFVIRRKMHYRFYALDCLDNNSDALPYGEWFDQVSDTPIFTSRVLNKELVASYLASLDEGAGTIDGRSTSAGQPALASASRSASEVRSSRYQTPTPGPPHGSHTMARVPPTSMPPPPARASSPAHQMSPAHLLSAEKNPSPLQKSSLAERQSLTQSPSLDRRPNAVAPKNRLNRANDRSTPSIAPMRHDSADTPSPQTVKPRPATNGIASVGKAATPTPENQVQSDNKSRRSLPWNTPKGTPTSTPKDTPKKAPALVKGKEPETVIEISDGEGSDNEEDNDDQAAVNVRPKSSKPMPSTPAARKMTPVGAPSTIGQAQVAKKSNDLRSTVSEAQLKPKAVTPVAKNNEARRVASATQSKPKPTGSTAKPMGPMKRALLGDDKPVPQLPLTFAKYGRRSMG